MCAQWAMRQGGYRLRPRAQSQTIEGHVTITATNIVATYHLPAVLKRLRELAPEIIVNVVTSNDIRDLTRREADIGPFATHVPRIRISLPS